MRLELIANPDSARIKKLSNLSRRSFRNKHNLTLVEGPGAVTELLKYYPELALDLFYTAREDFSPVEVNLSAIAELDSDFSSLSKTFTKTTSNHSYDSDFTQSSLLSASINFQAANPQIEPILKLALNPKSTITTASPKTASPSGKPEISKPFTSSFSAANKTASAKVIWIHPVTSKIASIVAPAAQGIFALARPVDSTPLSSRTDLSLKNDYILLLPQTQDPGNLGTLIRIADACGISRIVLNKGCCDPHSPKVIRASAGSYFHLPIHYGDSFADSVDILHQQGHKLFGADVYQAMELEEYLAHNSLLPYGITWAFGNEAHGFSTEELSRLDQCLKLPMWGKAESLNVSSAAAIILHRCASLGFSQ